MGKKEDEARRIDTAVAYYSEAFRSAMVSYDHDEAGRIMQDVRKDGLVDLANKLEQEYRMYADQEHGLRGSN